MIYEALQRPTEVAVAGERALYAALLEDAVACAQGVASPLGASKAAMLDRTWRWIDGCPAVVSFEDVCDVLGIAPQTLRARLEPYRNGAPPAPKPVESAPPRRIDTTEIAGLIRAGVPLREIAERVGLSISKVSILSGSLATTIKAERDAEIVRRAAEGETYRQIGGAFQLSPNRVLRIVRAARREAGESDATSWNGR